MAKISTIKNAVMLCKKSNVTAYIWGHRGLGKSSLVRQLCEENDMGFIDFRASQIEASDLRGLPDRVNGRTVYLPPADMPTADLSDEDARRLLDSGANPHEISPRRQRGILFLDEVNRAQDDVLQGVFQLVLDRRIGQYALPEGWSVVCAGNFMEGYQVSGFNDPAFLNRFCHLILSAGESSFPEWVEYMSDGADIEKHKVVEFTSSDLKYLDGQVDGELGFSIQPSRRSWEMVSRVLVSSRETGVDDETKLEVISGLVGREVAIAFSKYDCPIKPSMLVADGVKKHEKEIAKLTRMQTVGVTFGLLSHVKDTVDEQRTADLLLDFADVMLTKNVRDHDLVTGFLRNCVKHSKIVDKKESNLAVAALTNVHLAKALASTQKKSKAGFIGYLNARPGLQKLVQDVAWGS